MSKNILCFLSNYGPGFANKIADINAKFNMPIPWTASFIHQNRTGKRFHLYYNLADILRNNCINKYWAGLFVTFAGEFYVLPCVIITHNT